MLSLDLVVLNERRDWLAAPARGGRYQSAALH
jgi:hypothetical protein